MELNLEGLTKKIESELIDVIPDIQVKYYAKYQVLTEKNYIHNGERAYPGMIEGAIIVYWDRFFDRIAGNGWMFGRDWLFKFDAKDGSCKYDGYPATVTEGVEDFIKRVKAGDIFK